MEDTHHDQRVPLRDYIDREFCCLRESIAHALDATRRAELKAEQQLHAWQASQNEWRTTFSDKDANSISRREWDTAHQQLIRDIELLRRQFESHLADYLGAKAAWARMTTVVGVVAAVFSMIGGALVGILHYMDPR